MIFDQEINTKPSTIINQSHAIITVHVVGYLYNHLTFHANNSEFGKTYCLNLLPVTSHQIY